MTARSKRLRIWFGRVSGIGLLAALSACAGGPRPGASVTSGTMRPYTVNGVTYRPRVQPHYDEVGVATWYGAQYHHRMTSDGELFDMDKPSAAHTTLPLPSLVEVTNLQNGRRIRVRVNDRGPFVRGRILDLSREGAKELGFYGQGSTRVRVRYLGPAPLGGGGNRELAAADAARPSDSATRQSQPGPISSRPAPPVQALGPRVQAGAFADRGNAEAAQAALGNLGQVTLAPLERGPQTLWRVIVQGPVNTEASAMLSSVAAAGYPAAKVLSDN